MEKLYLQNTKLITIKPPDQVNNKATVTNFTMPALLVVSVVYMGLSFLV